MPVKTVFKTEIEHVSILDERGEFDAKLGKNLIPDDDAVRLARKTEWVEVADGFAVGVGQRILATDAEEYPLLECGIIDLQTAEAPRPDVTTHG